MFVQLLPRILLQFPDIQAAKSVSFGTRLRSVLGFIEIWRLLNREWAMGRGLHFGPQAAVACGCIWVIALGNNQPSSFFVSSLGILQ